MARTTKLELEQLLAKRNDEVQALRLKCLELEGTVNALKAQAAKNLPWRTRTVEKTERAPDPEVLRRRAAMAAAKEAAMSGKKVVAVSWEQ